jgi:hypothetical protein
MIKEYIKSKSLNPIQLSSATSQDRNRNVVSISEIHFVWPFCSLIYFFLEHRCD